MSSVDTYLAVQACAALTLRGTILQIDGISAGNGTVIDWRTVKNGETLQEGGDAFDTAQFFVALVGPEAALSVAVDGGAEPPPPFVPPPPHITAYMQGPNGGRRRSFTIGEFNIYVEPHENDEWQASFTARIAELISNEQARETAKCR